MPRIISPNEKSSVIGDWLEGETREKIALKHNIGSGTVYNIVQEWSNKLGIEKTEVLRELAVNLNKNGLTVNDCSNGFRMVMIFKKYRIKEDELEDGITYFLKEIYLKCQEASLTIQKVFMYIYDIVNFSNELPLSQISQFLKEKKKEKEELEISIQNLYQKINELEETQKEKRQEIQRLSEITKKLSSSYRLFTILKYKLNKYGISIENLDQFVNCVVGISKENYSVTKVLELIGDYDNLLYYIQLYKKEVEAQKDELNLLNQEINSRKELLDSYRIKSDIAEDLERMGFGINELQVLYDTLMEIGREKERYNSYPKVIASIERLSHAGISENDILTIDKIVSMSGTNHYRLYKDKRRYKQNLIDDLQKYGNLKLAIKNIEDKRKKINLKTHKKTQRRQK
jgi:hypothetical protein